MSLDTWHVTRDKWHMTHDTWHVTHEMWHMVGSEYFLKMLDPKLVQFGMDSVLKIPNKRMTESMNYELINRLYLRTQKWKGKLSSRQFRNHACQALRAYETSLQIKYETWLRESYFNTVSKSIFLYPQKTHEIFLLLFFQLIVVNIEIFKTLCIRYYFKYY